MVKVIESIEHDSLSCVMNLQDNGFDGQADIRTDGMGQKWVYCPWCHKKHFPINGGAIIIGLQYRCRNNHCKKEFIIGQ